MSDAVAGGLVKRLEALAPGSRRLYHAARVLLDRKPELPPEGEPVTRWWSGVDPSGGWDAFLSASRVFEAREYERLSRWHQVCYYGDDSLLNEYTRLAGEACGLLPMRFVRMGDFHRGIPHLNRDIWSFFLYRLAHSDPGAYGLDAYGLPPYSDIAFPDLAAVVAGTSPDRERDERMLDIFRERFRRGIGRTPQFIFAGLRVDVVSASLLGLRYLIEHRAELYGSCDLLDELAQGESVSRSGSDSEAIVAGESQSPPRKQRGQNEERDAWIYQQCVDGAPYAQIKGELGRRAKSTGWDSLESEQGVQQAAVRYADRQRLPRPQPRKQD